LPVSVTVPPSFTDGVMATLESVGATLRTTTSVVRGVEVPEESIAMTLTGKSPGVGTVCWMTPVMLKAS